MGSAHDKSETSGRAKPLVRLNISNKLESATDTVSVG